MYKILNQHEFAIGNYKIVPIRMEDRYKIMQWRNEQIYHLRQREPLTREMQDEYFNEVVGSLFEQDKPDQILFSYLKGNECIGYGGLVHINWKDKNAEISFIMETSREQNEFTRHWLNFLNLIEKVAFEELNLKKIFTYAFDLRPHLYSIFEKCGFIKEAVLKELYRFEDKFVNALIHSKYNEK